MSEKIFQELSSPRFDDGSIVTEGISLWGKQPPFSDGDGLHDEPMLTVHRPDPSSAVGCGIIVNPGGGYRSLASDHEGIQVAKWLNSIGVTAFVLRYRLGPGYFTDISLIDALRAIKLVRFFSNTYGIDKKRVGMLGFSAGGHLACNAAVRYTSSSSEVRDEIDLELGKPDFVVPVYAVTNGEKRGRKADEYVGVDTEVTKTTPPMFIVHNHKDSIVPASQSTLLYDALLQAGVDSELHIFNDGDHGLGLTVGDPDAGKWTELLKNWLVRRGFMTSKERLEVRGRVLLEQKPMGLGWVTLVPEEPNQPNALVRMHARNDGFFTIPVQDGPTAGPHRLEITLESQQVRPSATGIFTLQEIQHYKKRVTVERGLNLDLSLSKSQFSA